MLLVVPHVRSDLPRAWAEAPLLLGLVLCAVTFRTRWFPVFCAVAATFKLTALGVWPLVFLFHRIGKSRVAHTLALLVTVGVWTVLTPPAWFSGGPLFLGAMMLNRAHEHSGQSAMLGGPLGMYVPTRYLLPIELAVIVALILGIGWLARRLTSEHGRVQKIDLSMVEKDRGFRRVQQAKLA